MFDEISGGRFWFVKVLITDGPPDAFYVQTCQTKDAAYVEKVLNDIHPEFSEITVLPAHRPEHLERCYGDP